MIKKGDDDLSEDVKENCIKDDLDAMEHYFMAGLNKDIRVDQYGATVSCCGNLKKNI